MAKGIKWRTKVLEREGWGVCYVQARSWAREKKSERQRSNGNRGEGFWIPTKRIGREATANVA